MTSAFLRWVVLALAVWAADALVPGIHCDDGRSLLVAALVLGLLNAFVKPALRVLAIPFVVLTLGLFLVVINALLLLLTAALVPGFHIRGFWSAAAGSLVISVVSFFLGASDQRESSLVVRRVDSVSAIPRRPPPGKGPIIDV